MREYGLNLKDFDNEGLRACAVIASSHGQTGLYFKETEIRSYLEAAEKIPAQMISEQRLIRSFRTKDIPEGFPLEYRKYALFGQQIGRRGRATFYYSQEVLEKKLNIKIITPQEDYVLASEIKTQSADRPMLGLKITPVFQKMEKYYFGEVARKFREISPVEDVNLASSSK